MTVTINGTTGVTTPALNTSAGTANFDSLSAANNAISVVGGFQRNKIINGAMRIDQRNAGASVTQAVAFVYPVDRWWSYGPQASKFTLQRSSTAPAGFKTSVKITSSSAYSVAATDVFQFTQLIEGYNVADLGLGTAGAQSFTLSFWVQSSLTGTFGVFLGNSDANRQYPTSFTINSANTWEYKTITIAGDTTGTWLTDNGIGLRVGFVMGCGSTYQGTANTWNAGTAFAPTGSVSVVGTNGATFYITGVQLEAGSVATPFEHRQYGTELALCQRYFFKMSAVAPIANCYYASPAYCMGNLDWPVTMRATPTITIDSGHMFLVGDGTYSGVSGTVDRLYTLTFSGTGASGYVGRGLVSASSEL